MAPEAKKKKRGLWWKIPLWIIIVAVVLAGSAMLVNYGVSLHLRHYISSFEPVDYSGHPMGDLEALLREGLPVIFWATMFMRPSSYLRSWKSFDNPMKNISWGSQEHCLLLVGYDESHDYLNDPMDTDPANETHILKDHPDVVGYDRYLVSIRHLEKQNMAVSFRKKM